MQHDQRYLARRLTRRRLLGKTALASLGVAAGWLAMPRETDALLCPCDTWNCGMISPGAWLDGGRTIAVTCTVFGKGQMDVPFRIRATQSASGVAAQQAGGEIVVEREGTIRTTVSDDAEVFVPWPVEIEAPAGQTFSKSMVHFQCWLEPRDQQGYTFELDLPILQIGANEHFRRTWTRTDKPVWGGQASRTWMWGPEAFTEALSEEYAEAPDGARRVQYYDKSRMEITHPDGDPNSIWYVTNGLLVKELIACELQLGDDAFELYKPAIINVAGDADDPNRPTYDTFSVVLDAAPLASGSIITQRINRTADVSDDPALASQNVSVALTDDVTNHSIAAPFWEFMNSSGTVWEQGEFVNANLFVNPYYATGRSLSPTGQTSRSVGSSSRC